MPDLLDALSLWRFVLGQLEGAYLQVLIVSPISCRVKYKIFSPSLYNGTVRGESKLAKMVCSGSLTPVL